MLILKIKGWKRLGKVALSRVREGDCLARFG